MDDFEPTPGPLAELAIAAAPNPRRRSTLVVATAFVALAALISTTVIAVSSSVHPTVAAMIQAAPADTRNAGSAEMTSRVTMTIDGRSSDILDLSGTADFRTGDETLTMSGPATHAETRIVDHVEYISVPGLELPHGAHWVRITPADTGIGSSADLGLGTTDPGSGLEFLAANTRHPVAVGHETIDGAAVTHYKFTLDLTTLMAALGKAGTKLGASQLQVGLDQLRAVGTDLANVPADVWLDSANRVRRCDYTLSVDTAGLKFSDRQEMTFTNFGVAFTVSAPPAADVVPFSQVPDLFQRLAGGTTPAV